jgi:AraC family transcriptional regulator
MRENVHAKLSLDVLAGLGNFSPSHFSRVFREVTNLSPGRFLAALRIQEAKRLLATTERPVAHICHDVGFGSVPTFTRRFACDVGVSPLVFRRACVTGAAVGSLTRIPDHSRGRWLRGCVLCAEGWQGTVLIGAFPEPLAAAWPLTCAIARADGSFSLPVPPVPRFHVLALGISGDAGFLLPGGGAHQIGAVPGCRTGRLREIVIEMRAPGPVDPPVITAVPAFFLRLDQERPG